jgi:hypothetical protein
MGADTKEKRKEYAKSKGEKKRVGGRANTE